MIKKFGVGSNHRKKTVISTPQTCSPYCGRRGWTGDITTEYSEVRCKGQADIAYITATIEEFHAE